MSGIAFNRSNTYDSVLHHTCYIARFHLLKVVDFEVWIEELGRGGMFEVEAHAARNGVPVNSVVAVMHECGVLLERIPEHAFAVLVDMPVT